MKGKFLYEHFFFLSIPSVGRSLCVYERVDRTKMNGKKNIIQWSIFCTEKKMLDEHQSLKFETF